MVALILISVAFNIILLYISINLYRKYVKSEIIVENLYKTEQVFNNIITQINERYIKAYAELKRIDHRGSFNSDDEIGFIFKYIMNTIDQLNTFNNQVKEMITNDINIEEEEEETQK